MIKKIKAYLDLTRAHFLPAWPLLFVSGLILAFANYGGFSWGLIIKAVLIAVFGFEAGFVLNDYIDREYDEKDVEFNRLTKYFRPFGQRPIPAGLIAPKVALLIFWLLVLATTLLIFTLPWPNLIYVFLIMIYSFLMEIFYQVKKRNQGFPWSQIIGRTDFSLFAVAGYLCYGRPDWTCVLLFFYFYPYALAHLAANDLIDIKNDEARLMNSIPVLYGEAGAKKWVLGFTLMHLVTATMLVLGRGQVVTIGFLIGFALLLLSNWLISKESKREHKIIPLFLFHATLFIYCLAIILQYAL